MHNRQDKTALNTSREQFRELTLGVCISQLLSVCRDSKGHLSLHSWAGSQLEPINSQHLAQALSPALAIWNPAVLLPVFLHSSLLCRDPCQARASPESGLSTAWNGRSSQAPWSRKGSHASEEKGFIWEHSTISLLSPDHYKAGEHKICTGRMVAQRKSGFCREDYARIKRWQSHAISLHYFYFCQTGITCINNAWWVGLTGRQSHQEPFHIYLFLPDSLIIFLNMQHDCFRWIFAVSGTPSK